MEASKELYTPDTASKFELSSGSCRTPRKIDATFHIRWNSPNLDLVLPHPYLWLPQTPKWYVLPHSLQRCPHPSASLFLVKALWLRTTTDGSDFHSIFRLVAVNGPLLHAEWLLFVCLLCGRRPTPVVPR